MNFDYQEIDDVIHSRIRTSIMALLVSLEEAEFNFIKEKVNATDGNLSVHLKKLEEAGYVLVKKLFVDRKPVSKYKVSNKGYKAFENYIKQLESIVKKNN